uniref:Uncharacterized protein n=1 Tax=Anguilla anguilla TaxID=7936 RepID=A0A0E9TCS7_ANGAN
MMFPTLLFSSPDLPSSTILSSDIVGGSSVLLLLRWGILITRN